MTEVRVYSFPTMENPVAVERTFCQLLNAQRRGENLEEEEINWMESANCWLIEARSKNYG